MRGTLQIAAVLALSLSAFGQTIIERAAQEVPILQSRMNDPNSFVLIAVHTAVNKGVICDPGHGWNPCKRKTADFVTSVCYTFRAHNAMGGYGQPNVAVFVVENEDYLLKDQSRQLLVIGTENDAEHYSGMAIPEWSKMCRSRKFDKDITTEVKAALAPVENPTDKTKKAQQYADCLRMASDNPKITCKQ